MDSGHQTGQDVTKNAVGGKCTFCDVRIFRSDFIDYFIVNVSFLCVFLRH